MTERSCPFLLKIVKTRAICISPLVAIIWLSTSVFAEAQDTPLTANTKQIPNPVVQIQEKQVGTDFSEAGSQVSAESAVGYLVGTVES